MEKRVFLVLAVFFLCFQAPAEENPFINNNNSFENFYILCIPPTAPILDANYTEICLGTDVTLSASGSGSDVTYNYYTQASGGSSFASGTETTVSPTLLINTYWVEAESTTMPGCFSNRVSVNITVYTTPDIIDLNNQIECDTYSLPVITGSNLTGNQAYYTESGGTGAIYNAGDIIQYSDFPSYPVTIYLFDINGICSDEENFSLTLYSTPNIINLTDITVCGFFTLPVINGTNLTGSQAYYTATDGTGTMYEEGHTFGVGDFASYPTSLYIYDHDGICSDEERFALTIIEIPTISVNEVYCNFGASTYNVLFSYSTGNLSTTAGTISGSSVINIPNSVDITITTNNAGCEASIFIESPECDCASVVVPLPENPINQEVCFGIANPSLSVDLPAPTNEYMINWFGVAVGGTSLQNNSTTYTPTVTDPGTYTFYAETQVINSGCRSLRIPVTLTILPSPIISGDFYVCDYGLTSQLSGSGTANSTTPWISSNPDIAIVDNTGLVTSVAFGNTSIAYTDSYGCISEEPFSVIIVSLLEITDVASLCSLDDSITLEANIANGIWSGLGITDTIVGIFDPRIAGAGIHTITYNYNGPCGVGSDDTEITVMQSADATITNTGPFCITGDPTQLIAQESGGTWSGIATNSTTGIFQPQIAGIGDFTITYTIIAACGDTDEATFSVIDLFNSTITAVSPMCSNDPEITLIAATPGGTWSGIGITDSIAGIFNPTIAAGGAHTITYEYTGVCGTADDIEIIVTQSDNATILTPSIICEGTLAFEVAVAQAGGTWSGEGIDIATGIFDPVLNGLGDYDITYTITSICGDSDSMTLSVIEYTTVAITTLAQETCNSMNSDTIHLEAEPIGGIWFDNNALMLTDSFTPIDAGVGIHEIIYTLPAPCIIPDTVYMTVYEMPDATITSIDTLYEDDDFFLLETAQTGGIWYGIGVDDVGTFNPLIAGIGDFELIYTIDGVCEDSDTITITVLPAKNLIIPTAITADGDGHNDNWKIRGIEAYDNVSIKIFTRWGDEVYVFEGSGSQYATSLNQWDGKRNMKELPTGGYMYIIVLNGVDVYKGSISLIR